MAGLFVTFEGGEGSGKSTHIKLLAAALLAKGHHAVQTREPGGTPEAEALRSLLVNGDTGRWTAEAEALLNYAARDSHLQKVIRPALASGQTVLCDRFMDSTRAYQGYAGGCDMRLLDALETSIVRWSIQQVAAGFKQILGLYTAMKIPKQAIRRENLINHGL